MTEKEMRKLTDMIVDALTNVVVHCINYEHEQSQINNLLLNTKYVTNSQQNELYIEKIKDLQEELSLQLRKENYEIANTIKNVIDELKQRINEEL